MRISALRFPGGIPVPCAVLALLTLVSSSCGKPTDRDVTYDVDDGSRRTAFENKNFATLINTQFEGKPTHQPWAGTWWPYYTNSGGVIGNGIAFGRYGNGESPAGKYDAARGKQTRAQIWEVTNHSAQSSGTKVSDLPWTGHCNGWCVASALFEEPHHPVKVNGITFGIADIKGLLSEAGMAADADFYGNRVYSEADLKTPAFKDTVPNQYFLILTNYMGIHKLPVLIDENTGPQVWNQPLEGYRFEKPTPDDYKGPVPGVPGIYRINVRSRIWWAGDGVPADVQTPDFDFTDVGNVIISRALESELWLDGPVKFGADGTVVSSGDIVLTHNGKYFVGGRWQNEDNTSITNGWPDYMWVPFKIMKPVNMADKTMVNPYIDIDWITEHLVNPAFPNGKDDYPPVPTMPVDPAPPVLPPHGASPIPTPTPRPPFPFPFPQAEGVPFSPGPQPQAQPAP